MVLLAGLEDPEDPEDLFHLEDLEDPEDLFHLEDLEDLEDQSHLEDLVSGLDFPIQFLSIDIRYTERYYQRYTYLRLQRS